MFSVIGFEFLLLRLSITFLKNVGTFFDYGVLQICELGTRQIHSTKYLLDMGMFMGKYILELCDSSLRGLHDLRGIGQIRIF